VENLHVKFREVDGQVARVALGQETNHKVLRYHAKIK
jgi:hypothetical protein